jgi:hypothetical protein
MRIAFYFTAGSSQPWIPVLVLSKSNIRLREVFRFIGSRGYSSEFFEFNNRADFNPLDKTHILCHLRSAFRFCEAADFHQSKAGLSVLQTLVDRSGTELLRELHVLQNRELGGLDKHGRLKFYVCKADAENALTAERQVS